MIRSIFKILKKIGIRFILALSDEPHLSLVPLAAFIGGVITYFALSFEPSVWILAVFSFIFAGLCFVKCKRLLKVLCIVTPLFFIGGILLPTIHARFISTQFITHTVLNVELSGKVIEARTWPNRTIVDIKPYAIRYKKSNKSVFLPYEMPDKIRLTVYQGEKMIHRGDVISGTVSRLVPPAPPTTPHSSSQAAQLWFEGIAATGIMIQPDIIAATTPIPAERLVHILEPLRNKIHSIFHRIFSDENAGIAEALVVGNTDYVSDSSRLLYRTLGLSHILAVSGFHISLIAFLVFGFVRLLLNLLPEFLSTMFVRRIAAIAALAVSGFYMILSGAQPPVMRAFIMITLVMLAVFFDKRPFSLRSVFIAAVGMLCVVPHMILSISFQLSFMAILCLVGICVVFQNKMRHQLHRFPMKILGGLGVLIMFNIVVTLATLPYVAFYFHQIQTYTLIGNVLLSSVFGFTIIPLLFIGVIFMNSSIGLGLFAIVDWLLTVVYQVGMPISLWPHATIITPPFYIYGLVLWTFGLIGLIIFKTKIRWLFVLLIGLSMASLMNIEKPIGMIGAGGQYMALQNDKEIAVSESFYYPRWHTAFLMYHRLTSTTYVPQKLNTDSVNMNGFTVGLESQNCSNNMLNIYKNKNISCPHTITTAQMWDMHSLCVYESAGQFRIWIAGNVDKGRPWGTKEVSLPFRHPLIAVEP